MKKVILQSLKARTRDGGGFWDRHPSWDERIANIQERDHVLPQHPPSETK